jgi:hypothetical protein
MKTISFIITLLLVQLPPLFSQDMLAFVIPTNTGSKAEYTEATAAKGLSKSEMYDRARAWFYKHYQSNRNTVSGEDKESGKITGKGATQPSRGTQKTGGEDGYFNYTISFSCQEGKFLCAISDISYQPNGISSFIAGSDLSADMPLKYANHSRNRNLSRWKEMQYQANTELQSIMASLKEFVLSPDAH